MPDMISGDQCSMETRSKYRMSTVGQWNKVKILYVLMFLGLKELQVPHFQPDVIDFNCKLPDVDP